MLDLLLSRQTQDSAVKCAQLNETCLKILSNLKKLLLPAP